MTTDYHDRHRPLWERPLHPVIEAQFQRQWPCGKSVLAGARPVQPGVVRPGDGAWLAG
jgi:hypothetical protein